MTDGRASTGLAPVNMWSVFSDPAGGGGCGKNVRAANDGDVLVLGNGSLTANDEFQCGDEVLDTVQF